MCQVKALKLHKKCSTPLDPSIVYIVKDEGNIGICEKCWAKIADKDWEWGNSPKLTMEQILSEESRVGKNPTLTEYKIRGNKKGKFSDSDELSDVERKELETEEEENE